MLSIQLLGSPQITLDGQVVKLARRKSRALLYYLAAHENPLKREHLLSVFWPDTPRSEAQQVLRTTIHGLRKALGPALLVEGETISLEPDAQVDARVFEKTMAASSSGTQSLAAAMEFYQGDFLADFSLPDSQSFEDWAAIERERLRRLAIRGLAALSAAYAASQDYPAALAALDRALAFNPLQEDLQRESIRLYYLAGDRPGSIRRYDELRRLLDEEMGVPPMAETRALYDAILNDRLPVLESAANPPRSVRTREQVLFPDLRSAHSGRPGSHSIWSASTFPGRAQLSASATTGGSLSSISLPFTGRSAELKFLSEQAVSGKLVLIEGEAGIGKTRLAEEFIQSAGALALVGRSRELEQALPYHPVSEALRALLHRPDWPALQAGLVARLPVVWLSEAGRLLPEIASPTTGAQPLARPADESRLWEGINQFLTGLAHQHPLILFLDDLHWADASTLALLGYLVRQTRNVPVGFLATARLDQPRSPLMMLEQALTREERLARLPLARLLPADVREIARTLSRGANGLFADWLLQTSEGNPYILVELVRYARENGIILPAGKVNLDSVSSAPVVPQTVYSLIQSRLGRISDGARRVLDTAVAAGREFEFEVVARAAGLSETAALDALDELRAAGLVHVLDGTRFAFDHSLTMEVAYREVGELRHRLLHRRVAEALEALHHDHTDPVAGLLAWHFAEGNDPKRAAPYALQAGQQATRLAAWAEAIAFYEQALQNMMGAQRLQVLLALGESHARAGHFVQASETFRDALKVVQENSDRIRPDPIRINKIRADLARSLLPQARFGEVISLARELLNSGIEEFAGNGELLWGTALSLEGSDLKEAARHLEATETICRKLTEDGGPHSLEDLTTLAQAKFELGSVAAQLGDLPQAIEFYRQSLDTALRSDSEAAVDQRILAYNNLAYHLHLLGDPSAEDYARTGLDLAGERGSLGLQPYLLSTLGEIALAGKDFDSAESYFTLGLEIAERFSMPERIAGLTANLGLVSIRRGQTALAIHRLSKALGLADALGTRHLAAQVRIWLIPLLPPSEGRARLVEARVYAESTGRQRLLEELDRLQADFALRP